MEAYVCDLTGSGHVLATGHGKRILFRGRPGLLQVSPGPTAAGPGDARVTILRPDDTLPLSAPLAVQARVDRLDALGRFRPVE